VTSLPRVVDYFIILSFFHFTDNLVAAPSAILIYFSVIFASAEAAFDTFLRLGPGSVLPNSSIYFVVASTTAASF
jgi:hypothetical protein